MFIVVLVAYCLFVGWLLVGGGWLSVVVFVFGAWCLVRGACLLCLVFVVRCSLFAVSVRVVGVWWLLFVVC